MSLGKSIATWGGRAAMLLLAHCGPSETPVCPVPTKFQWSSSDALISPISDATHDLVAIKDPTVVFFNGKWHVYASVVSTTTDPAGAYNMVYLSFTSFDQAGSAAPYYMDKTPGFAGYHAAPQLFYFAPQSKWYLVFQSGPPQYSTADDPSRPETWTPPQSFFASEPDIVTQNAGSPGIGWIDFWVICDDTTCFLFFENDNGTFFRSQTPIGSFPHGFSTPVIAMQDTSNMGYNVFEASNVYKIKGANKYLAIIEAIGATGRRYFRSWTADALDGAWTPLAATEAHPFAGASDVTFSGAPWTNDISHGEMLRDGYDQTLEIDTCNLQYLYQGKDPTANPSGYNLFPWKLGLLTKKN